MWRCWLLGALLIAGCARVDKPRTIQQKNLTHKALENISAPVSDFTIDFEAAEIEDSEGSEPAYHKNFYKPISISVSENMKLREALTQMANLAGVNIFIGPNVEGNISFTAHNRPFLDVLKDICVSAELQYEITGNSVRVEVDTPQLKVYNVQFLNAQRDTQNSVSISTDIFMNQSISTGGTNTAQTSTSSNANNGSNSNVSGTAKNDFWAELEAALNTIVGDKEGEYVSAHKQGGVVTVYATQSKQNAVQKYLRMLKDSAEAQVLIEAKILEVNLNDEFKGGINWNILRHGGATVVKDFSNRTGLFSAGINRENLNVVAGLIEKFGAVKTLSSPRITVLNNQSAILKVAQNEVIYLPELQRQYATVADSRSTDFLSTTLHTIPIGLVMAVQPSVDKAHNTVILNLRPTISKIVKYKKVPFFFHQQTDPTTTTNQTGLQMQDIPVVDVRELDSVLKLRSGQIVVMGGLMQEKSRNYRDGFPHAEEMDFIAGAREKTTEVTELVIFLRATILQKRGKAHHNADRKVYETFANDPRPLRFKK
ncbi:MAG: secretin N-terminal domain-containing protein [Alphaproteobacteria bacterium]|nr:secretin N-terminal domain-containing protein [Alphaproteobacteria bacterium]